MGLEKWMKGLLADNSLSQGAKNRAKAVSKFKAMGMINVIYDDKENAIVIEPSELAGDLLALFVALGYICPEHIKGKVMWNV